MALGQSIGDEAVAEGEADNDYLLAKPRPAEAPDYDYSTVVQCTGQDCSPIDSRTIVNTSHTNPPGASNYFDRTVSLRLKSDKKTRWSSPVVTDSPHGDSTLLCYDFALFLT
jgi:hypothetical protein